MNKFFLLLTISACGTTPKNDPANLDFCEMDPTWICPELCGLMDCGGPQSDCINACTAELNDCDEEELFDTCTCFETHLSETVCQTWEAAQPDWEDCIQSIGCFDDY